MLVFVGIVTAGVIFWQSWETRKAAQATSKSADALIRSERAWLLVEIDWDRKKWSDGKFHRMQGSGSSGNLTVFDVELICRNEGGSPAWIDEKRAVCIFVPVIPPKPMLDNTVVLQSGSEPIGIGQSIPHTTKLPWFVMSEGHGEKGEILLIYGVVKYRDPFGTYQTTFGYRVLTSGPPIRLEGYPEYNWNT